MKANEMHSFLKFIW